MHIYQLYDASITRASADKNDHYETKQKNTSIYIYIYSYFYVVFSNVYVHLHSSLKAISDTETNGESEHKRNYGNLIASRCFPSWTVLSLTFHSF